MELGFLADFCYSFAKQVIIKNPIIMKRRFMLMVLLAIRMACGAQVPCWDGTVAEAYAGGDGTAENPYQIATAEQLALLANQVNGGVGNDAHYILMNDICLNGSEGLEWPVIGLMPYSFTGVFDGNGFTINDFLVNDHDIAGFFGTVENATISNVRLTGAAIYDYGLSSFSMCTGILAGRALNTNIINCSVDGEMDCLSSKLGGVVGSFMASYNGDTVFIRDCENNANLFSYNNVGGIAGYTDSNYGILCIEGCVNRGNVLDGTFCGGMVGQGSFHIRHCENYGTITASVSAGGMVGEGDWDRALIAYCTNRSKAEIKGECAGGIIGTSRGARMLMCVNQATVTGTSSSMILAGGIAGSDGSFLNCYNRGDVTYEFHGGLPSIIQMGGITGTPTSGYVYNVYNTGAIHKSVNPMIPNQTYGIIIPAILSDTTIRNCYWFGDYEIPEYVYNADSHSYVYLPGSCAFNEGPTPTTWTLETMQYGTADLVEALNLGAMGQCVWMEDESGLNDGFPVFVPPTPHGLDDPEMAQFGLYPNPTNGILFVETCQGASLPVANEYRITNLIGQIVQSGQIVDDGQQIDVSALPIGLYFFTIDGATKKFIVK